MKLPISLLVLAALSQALSEQITKRSEVKTLEAKTTLGNTTEDMPTVAKNSATEGSGTKQMDNNHTSKRELFEGNFGEPSQEIGSKYEVKGPPRKNAFAKELQEMISEQYPVRQMFSGRLLQIAKISDVLSEHAPSFEAAVARQLNSPVPVYQTILSEPTSFEVPTPAASQSGYSNPNADRLRNEGQDEQKLQGVLSKSVKKPKAAEQANPSLPRYILNQPRLRFDTHPQSLDSGLARQHEKLPKEVFRPQEVPTKNLPLLYPLDDQREPFRYPGQGLQSQHSQPHGILKILSIARDFNKSNEGNRDRDYSSEENWNVKGPKLQIDIPVHKQGYHAHPNGAISFARFTHNLHGSAQHDTAPQAQSETFYQPQPVQYQAQAIPIQLPQQVPPELMLQSEQPNEATVKQKLQYPPSLQGLIEEIEKYQPLYEQQSKFNIFNHQIQQQPRTLNALQQHLLLQEPRQSSNLQTVQLQRVPALTPLSQSLTPEFYFKKASRSPITQSPRPFSYSGQSENNDLSLGQASAQLNSLPPLKPNYSKYVKPLESNTSLFVLPTPLKTIPTFTAKVKPVTDQLISSTTIQPDVRGQENPKTQSMQKETELQSKTPQPPKPEVFHPSLLTVLPAVQTATYLPFVTNEPQSIFSQYTTTQPTYQSTSRPTPQRHDVVIQRQEIQEIFFEPSLQLSSTPRRRNKPALVFSPEEELYHLRGQHPHYQLFEQLLPYKHEYQDIHSPQQYTVHAREPQQKPENRGKPQQYLVQQHSFPTPHLHPLQQFQQQLLQNQQPELEQSHQQQQGLNQAQQLQELGQAHQQQQQEALEKSQQQVFEQVQQQRLNQAQQQQESEPAHQQQQQALEQVQKVQQQKQESEKAQHQIQESEQAQQYQKISLEPSNQIHISTLMPPLDTEKQTETVKIQQQTESQTELQQDSKLQSSTGKPEEPPEHLSELNFQQPYLGPILTPSVVPQLIARQQLIPQPDHSPLLGVPSYSDIQYFGKFAETLFGNQ